MSGEQSVGRAWERLLDNAVPSELSLSAVLISSTGSRLPVLAALHVGLSVSQLEAHSLRKLTVSKRYADTGGLEGQPKGRMRSWDLDLPRSALSAS